MTLNSNSFTTSGMFENNYKLALKFFMNKNFNKSFEILQNMFPVLFSNLKNESISESMYIKILNIYLIEIGLYFQATENFKISKDVKTSLLKDLNSDKILSDLMEYYRDINDLPMELLYNLFLIYYIVLDLKVVDSKFEKLYTAIDFDSFDPVSENYKYLRKLVELFILKVLPDLDRIGDARLLLNETPIVTDKHDYTVKLNKLENEKAQKVDNEARSKEQRIQDSKKRENAKKLEKDLKYRSLKQIKQENEPKNIVPRSIPASTPPTNINNLRAQLFKQYKLVKHFMKENSPLLLLAIVILVISTKLLRSRKVNVMQNLKQTLQMAFKISYL